MRFLSLFSGIEAASEAWAPLGWECAGVAEIDPFACAVLAHRHPHVPNLGDITKITEMQIAALGHIDLIVFGSPCQDLSVAGKQKGLSGERSGLFYPAVDIINWARLWCGARFALWENVPGAFSSNQGRDFAAVVGTLAGLDDIGVPPKGCAVGSEAMVEWATLDAQWFGVAQRRRRIFALADFGNWVGRPPVLLEPEGVRGDSAPSREAREGVARGVEIGPGGGGFTDTAPTLDCRCKNGPVQNQVGLGVIQSVRRLLSETCMASGQANAEIRTDGGVPTLTCLYEAPIVTYGIRTANTSSNGWGVQVEQTHTLDRAMGVAVCVTGQRTHTLTAEGFDASEDGTGRGTPVVAFNPNQVTSPTNRSRVEPGAPCPTLTKFGEPTCVTFPANLSGTQCASAENLAPAMTAENPTVVAHVEVAPTMRAGGNQTGGDRPPGTDVDTADSLLTTPTMQVRRLTPVECERLQGFPDGHTDIPWTEYQRIQKLAAKTGSSFEVELKKRGKVLRGPKTPACPDGPRYKALGNSMAVPVMRWIGQKIDVALLFQE